VGQAVLTLAGLNVLLAAEAKAGMQVKAIAEDRMKVMRRMGDLALVQFNRDMRNLNLMGSGMPDYGFARCDRHHETVDFRLRKIGASRRSAIEKD
jgi:hypothetical protein